MLGTAILLFPQAPVPQRPKSAEPRTELPKLVRNAVVILRNRFNVNPSPADLTAISPRVKSIGAVPLSPATPQGNVLLLVEFENAKDLPKVLPISTEKGDILLRDDGKEGDQRAGDGVYSESGFLTGIDVADPSDGTPTRHFADLQRRADDLNALLNSPCIFQLPRPPIRMTH